jgi:hypothetical protein
MMLSPQHVDDGAADRGTHAEQTRSRYDDVRTQSVENGHVKVERRLTRQDPGNNRVDEEPTHARGALFRRVILRYANGR